jgi:hypothetical protein
VDDGVPDPPQHGLHPSGGVTVPGGVGGGVVGEVIGGVVEV